MKLGLIRLKLAANLSARLELPEDCKFSLRVELPDLAEEIIYELPKTSTYEGQAHCLTIQLLSDTPPRLKEKTPTKHSRSVSSVHVSPPKKAGGLLSKVLAEWTQPLATLSAYK